MNPQKAFNRYFALFITSAVVLFLLLPACNKKTDDIGKKIDTVTNKVGKEIDTLTSKITTKDSTFDAVKVTEVEESKMAGKDLRKKLNNVFDHYMDIQENLAKDDSTDIMKHTNEMKKELTAAVNDTSAGAAGKTLKTWSGSLDKIATQLGNAKTLAEQRKLFSQLSTSMEEMIKTYGLSGETIYKIRCSKSGTWLQDSKDKSNPYTGKDKDKSAGCFEVVEAWKFK